VAVQWHEQQVGSESTRHIPTMVYHFIKSIELIIAPLYDEKYTVEELLQNDLKKARPQIFKERNEAPNLKPHGRALSFKSSVGYRYRLGNLTAHSSGAAPRKSSNGYEIWATL
jgi:hypothetical protein